MYSRGILSISEVNALPPEQFDWLFGNVVEHYSTAAQHVAAARPFASVKSLKKCFDDYLEKLNISEKENVLLRHQDLAGKLSEGLLTAESQFEQECVELKTMTKEEKEILLAYNELYKEKFRFTFVICLKGKNFPTILAAIQMRLQNTRNNELHNGIQEVKKICSNRINDLVWSDVQ